MNFKTRLKKRLQPQCAIFPALHKSSHIPQDSCQLRVVHSKIRRTRISKSLTFFLGRQVYLQQLDRTVLGAMAAQDTPYRAVGTGGRGKCPSPHPLIWRQVSPLQNRLLILSVSQSRGEARLCLPPWIFQPSYDTAAIKSQLSIAQ